MKSKLFVIKKNGESVVYDDSKLMHSLLKSGAEKKIAKQIVSEIEKTLHTGISTEKIYKNAFQKLSKINSHTASRYSLKKGLLEIGPSGFPFEKYISEIFNYLGYTTKVSVIFQGKCVQHEVDVVAENSTTSLMIECKFHHTFDIKCDVKIPLYIHARFNDIEKNWKDEPDQLNKKHQGVLVTNTRFSEDAIDYGNCVNLQLLSWDYPKKDSLKELITKSGLYPITCLQTLSSYEKSLLLSKNIVLCKQLTENKQLLKEIGINEVRITKIINDAIQLHQTIC